MLFRGDKLYFRVHYSVFVDVVGPEFMRSARQSPRRVDRECGGFGFADLRADRAQEDLDCPPLIFRAVRPRPGCHEDVIDVRHPCE